MPSILLTYENDSVTTNRLEGNLRSLAWEHQSESLILVGDHGKVMRLSGGKQIELASKSAANLRGISVNHTDGSALIVGNAGTLLVLNSDDEFRKINMSTSENLRCAAWNIEGSLALIAGNNGTLLEYAKGVTEVIDGARANLRHISWRPKSDVATISSNCFAEEFIPSPNLFRYRLGDYSLTSLHEGRADLIGVDWKPDGTSALVVGYDVVWHVGIVAEFDGRSVTTLKFEGTNVYPVRVSWHPSGRVAAIATATTQLGIAKGAVMLWEQESIKTIYENPETFFGAVAWSRDGKRMAALASTATRTFNC